jgi:predicted permease
MRWNSVRQRIRSLLFRQRVERDLDEELNSHLEFQFRKHLAGGMSEEEARRRARVEFGAVESAREECREVDRWGWFDAGARHLKHCFRSLGRSPGFVTVSLLLLTVGIGSNVAVFSTVDALLLRPLPVERPEELLKISLVGKKGHLSEMPSTGLAVLQGNRSLQGICGFDMSSSGVEIADTMRPFEVAGFTGDCFKTLGLHLQLGRPITPDDDRLGTAGIAVITDSLWQREFGGRPDTLGKTLKMGGQLYTIVGITQRSFTGLLLGSPQEIMIPLLQRPNVLPNGKKQTWYWVSILARRAPGISEGQAHAGVLAQKSQLLQESVPWYYNAAQRREYLSRGLSVLSGRSGIDYWLRRRFSEPLYAIFGICALMLLLACVNLTSLLLARAFRRRQEISIRLALGAKQSQIAGLFVLEVTILILAGTMAGALAGLWTARTMVAQGGAMLGNFRLDLGFDGRVWVFLAVLDGFILIAFAVASVWQANRLSRSDTLAKSGRGAMATNSFAQKTLLGTQIALTLAFVAAGACLGTSLKNMYRIPLGIDPRSLWEMELAGHPNRFDPAAASRGLLREVEALSDIQSASLADIVPFWSYDVRDPVAILENAQTGEIQARTMGVGDSFFETLGAKMVAGEGFHRNDVSSGELTAILSESLARRFGNPSSLVGQHVRIGNAAEYQRLRVIGIASDADLDLANLGDTKPYVAYINFWQHRDLQGRPVLLIKTKGDALPSAAIRRLAKQKGYEYIDRVTTISSEIDNALVENRFLAYASGWFGALALLLAAVGLFGLLSYQVANRTGEIGIRMALGAQRPQIRRLIVGQIVPLLAWGMEAGLALTFALNRLLAHLFYDVNAYDPRLLLLSVAVLTATAVAAAWIPVQRASSIDPMQALRHE